MANQLQKFDTLSCGPDKHIVVEYPTLKPGAGDTIEFQNSLNGNVQADIRFFEVGAKDSSPVPGFCDEEAGGVFSVPGMGTGGGKRTCTVADTMSGVYQYSVNATNHEELDPVIIIDQPGPGFSPLVIGGLAGVAATFIVQRFYRAYTKRKDKSSTPEQATR